MTEKEQKTPNDQKKETKMIRTNKLAWETNTDYDDRINAESGWEEMQVRPHEGRFRLHFDIHYPEYTTYDVDWHKIITTVVKDKKLKLNLPATTRKEVIFQYDGCEPEEVIKTTGKVTNEVLKALYISSLMRLPCNEAEKWVAAFGDKVEPCQLKGKDLSHYRRIIEAYSREGIMG
jgi:hypothetical protein